MDTSILYIGLALSLCSLGVSAQNRPGMNEKDGSCPVNVEPPACENVTNSHRGECEMDADCKGKLKCCKSGCASRCLLPLQDKRGSCPRFHNNSACALRNPGSPDECHQDLQCPGKERCCCTDCVRKCTDTVIETHGQCPPPKPCPAETIENNCQKDGHCGGQLKCCDACGRKCVKPTPERAGFCPVSMEPSSCMAILNNPLCFHDADCPPAQKCCLSSNRMECMNPMAEKNGICPNSELKCIQPPPPPLCKDDGDCPGNKKCCAPLCRKECIEPITDKPGNCVEGPAMALCPSLPSRCFKDFQCPSNQKCCNVNCRMQCADPVF